MRVRPREAQTSAAEGCLDPKQFGLKKAILFSYLKFALHSYSETLIVARQFGWFWKAHAPPVLLDKLLL